MNDLELCKKFAELEGKHSFEVVDGIPFVAKLKGWVTRVSYNPITDLALNCAARDKYKVQIDYRDKDITVWLDDEATTADSTKYSGDEDIPRAVIECILKSKGLL